jgi:TonB family protein
MNSVSGNVPPLPEGTSAARTAMQLARRAARAPKLNWELSSWSASFRANLFDLFFRRRPAPLLLTARPARFWADVFVDQSLNWKNMARSYVYHALAIGIGYMASLPFYMHEGVVLVNPLEDSSLTYYQPSEYIPPVEIKTARARVERKGDVRRQPDTVLSVSHRAENTEQTVIAPEPPKIAVKAALPNLIAFSRTPQAPPVASVSDSKPKLVFPEVTPIAPPPDLSQQTAKLNLPTFDNSAVPPAPQTPKNDKWQVQIVSVDVTPVNAEPKLPVPTLSSHSTLPAAPEPIAPTPESAATAVRTKAAGALMALNLNPSPAPTPEVLQVSNRRGMFATSPYGREAGSGEPDLKGGADGPGGESYQPLPNDLGIKAVLNSAGKRGVALAKAAPAPQKPISEPTANLKQMMMAAVSPRIDLPPRTVSSRPAEASINGDRIDNQVFRGRKYYTMALNAPNLSSAGGSWILRFAELESTGHQVGELIAPVAIEKVDPAYPADLMREKVEGVVVLRAVIKADGNVDEVQVLEGFDDRLDENAKRALLHWHFAPAMKNGNPVDLEAVVRIPFRARRTF